jgi:hypothetical protein
MKKFLLVSLFFLGFGLSLFAQVVTQEQGAPTYNRFYLGAGFSTLMTTGDFISSVDFGFLLYKNEKLNFGIRNAALLEGGKLRYGGVENFLFSLSDKIIVESISSNQLFRYYVFLQGGIGIYGNENKAYFASPVAYNYGAGLGIDFFVKKATSIFLDFTYLSNVLESERSFSDSFNPKFTIGAHHFF